MRVQGTPDHVHGACDLHALTAVRTAEAAAARGGRARLVRLPGPVARHGAAVLDALVG